MFNFSLFLALSAVSFFSNINTAPLHFKNAFEVLHFIKPILPSKPVILEAGGHYGEDSQLMKTVWPEATMYIFEPLPSSFQKILENTCSLTNIYCYNAALGNTIGETKFYLNPNNDGASSIGHPVDYNEHEFNKEPLTVNITTLDSWAQQEKPLPIDFMWLDMEGYELYALQAATTILDSVKVIYTEINFIETRIGIGVYTKLKKFLKKHNFIEIWKSTDSGRQGDALFIKKNLLNR